MISARIFIGKNQGVIMRHILVESSYGSIWREIVEGITWYARERRLAWQIDCVTTEELPGGLKLKPAGAICLLRHAQGDLIGQLVASRIPAVNILRQIDPDVPTVMSDNEMIGQRAAEHLYGQGYRQFYFAGADRMWSVEREHGFRRALEALGQRVESCPVPLKIAEMRTLASGRGNRRLEKWVSKIKTPAAIFVAADFIGRVMVETCGQSGISVPEEAAVLGVDNDLAICDLTSVPLSSIPQNMRRMGFEAARLLEGLMKGRRRPGKVIRVPPREVVMRRSTDFIAINSPRVADILRQLRGKEVDTLDMKKIVEQAGISRQWLDREFRAKFGTTPSAEIRRRKLAAARTLLLETHLSVEAVALRCGFTQGENLSRFFRQHVGLSPREFRRRHGFVG